MAIDETKLTKAQLRELSALQNQSGTTSAKRCSYKWLARQANPAKADRVR